MDMATIATVFSTLDTARNMAGALIGIRDEQQVRSKVIELQAIILEAQGSAMAAQRDMMELQNRLDEADRKERESNAWAEESARYALTDFGGGTYAYKLARPKEGEPGHLICPKCFEHRKRSVLQFDGNFGGQKGYQCAECEKRFFLGEKTRG